MTGSPQQTQAYLERLRIRATDQVTLPPAYRHIEGLADEPERAQTLSWRKACAFLKTFATSAGSDRDWKAMVRFTAGPYL